LNQLLTPYDILRLKTCLGLSSSVFLQRFTRQHTGPETGLPVIAFKTSPENGHACPFVSNAGCRVYRDRPSSCRMYPLARAVSRSRKTGRRTEHFALLREPHCRGHQQRHRESQGLGPYNTYNDQLLELIHRRNSRPSAVLDSAALARVHLALYDLDAFRAKAFDGDLFSTLSVDRDIYEKAREKDTALLQVGIDWLNNTLFKL
jgi:Fe-S-cluster containining protein